MKNAIFTIMKKELRRFFEDKRMVFSTILLPGLMIFVMYTFMGDAMSKQFAVDDKFSPKVEAVNMPADVAGMAKEMGMKVKEIPSDKLDESKKKVSDKKLDLCIKFDDNFAANVALKRFIILDFLRDTAFLVITPFVRALSSSF